MEICVKQVAIFIVFVSFVLSQGVASADNSTLSTTATPTSNPNSTTPNVTTTTSTTQEVKRLLSSGKGTSGLLQRSLYVAIGISSIVAIYFIVRAIKTRGRRKAKKYGVIHGAGSMELQPLEKGEEEDEEDMTLFERKDTLWPK